MPDQPWRVRPCGWRLDDPATPPEHAGEILVDHDTLELQTTLLELLDPHGPASSISIDQPTTAAQYFVDLRILACLITASWPAAHDLVVHDQHADLIGHHAHDIRCSIVKADGPGVDEAGLHDKPALDVATCAALFSTAHAITANHDPTSTRQLLRRCLLHATPPVLTWIKK